MINATNIVIVIEAFGFTLSRVNGSHHIFAHPNIAETFHEFSNQLVGFEAAQLRNEEAIKHHFCLSCIAQSTLQEASCSGQKSEQFDVADEYQKPIGQ
ncbi:MAG: type II toxin-antitoxin system HicA family toxin [Cyanobacteria bacterium P01_E01_bin.6]